MRDPSQVRRFPHLTPAQPQPLDGTGVFVATPHWFADATSICLDATRVNGRLFAVDSPTYADHPTLCDLAGLPDRDISVYVGSAQDPLADGVLAHLVTGVTVTFVPLEDAAPTLWDMGQLLLEAAHWSSVSMFDKPDTRLLPCEWPELQPVSGRCQSTYQIPSGHSQRARDPQF